jgi:ABC-type Fe3+-siderophore transport system permease subunit
MTPRPAASYTALLVLLVIVTAGALLLGQGNLSDPSLRATFLELRATRIAASFLAGAALAVGGAVMQGVFRNPLVSPSILGTTAGAMLGGQLALLALALVVPASVRLQGIAELVLPLGCLLGALLALVIVLVFCRERTSTLVLLLTGFILSSLFLSLSGFVTSFVHESWDLGRAIVAFTLGGVGGVSRAQILVVAPLVVVAIGATWMWGRTLDVLLSGEEEASTLGVAVGETRRWTIVWVAVLTAAAVSVGGSVAFVGLIVPHVLRPFVGVLHRRLVPASALLGGTFLVACDVLARTLPSRSEIPLGVITGLVGAPVFLVLLARSYREIEHG